MVCETLNLNCGRLWCRSLVILRLLLLDSLPSSLPFLFTISMKRDIIVPLPTPLGPHTINGCSVRRRCECDVVVAAGTPDNGESVGEEANVDVDV